MAISWGAYVDGLQVGIELLTSDSTPSYGESITITCHFYLQSNKTFADNETFNWSFNGASGSLTVSNPSHASELVLTKTCTKTAGSSAITISASGTGHTYDGGAPSESTSITIPAVSGVPDTPAAPTVSSILQNSAKVSWKAPGTNGASITGYKLAYRIGSGAWTYVTLGNVTTYTLTGLTPGSAYSVEVSAASSVGYSAYSSATGFSTPAATAPAVPTNVIATDGTAVSGGTATPGVAVSWVVGSANGSTGVTSQVYVSTSSAAPNSGTAPTVTGLTGTSVTVTAGVAAGTTYYAWVRQTGSAGTSAWSAVASATTQASGAQGDLVDRIDAFATQIGTDVSGLAHKAWVQAWVGSAQSVGTSSTTLNIYTAGTNTEGSNGVYTGPATWTGNTPSMAPDSSNRIPITQDGTYQISGKLSLAGTTWTAGKYLECVLHSANLGTLEFDLRYPPGGVALGTTPAVPPTWTGHLSAGDFITLVGIQSETTGTFNLVTGAEYTSIYVRRLGA